jgi:hypothetical protein
MGGGWDKILSKTKIYQNSNFYTKFFFSILVENVKEPENHFKAENLFGHLDRAENPFK